MPSDLDQIETPRLLIDLNVLDSNLQRMQAIVQERNLDLRVHFKSLKCGGLARYLQSKGVDKFLCAKVNEAEVLVDAGIPDVFIANQVIGASKIARMCELAKRAKMRVCVDDKNNVTEMGRIATELGVTIEVLVEVDIGMKRCGVDPGEPALALAQHITQTPGLRFVGLQGYDGHLQLLNDPEKKQTECQAALKQLIDTRDLIVKAGIPVEVVTGAGTGTSGIVSQHPGITEIQPGSFLLMDNAYHAIRPEFAQSLSILCTVISRRPEWYVLDAGSKAISQDFGPAQVKGRADEKVTRLSEEHANVASVNPDVKIGDRVEVTPAHCCATMNLHRRVLAIRDGQIEADWAIEASGRYD